MFIIEFTHSGDAPKKGEPDLRIPFPTPVFFTGVMLERWPEYLHDRERAHRFATTAQANAYRAGFTERRLTSKAVPA